MKLGIIGFGGFGKEVYWSLKNSDRKKTTFFVNDEFYINGVKNLLPISKLDINKYKIIVAVGNPLLRKQIIDSLPEKVQFFTHIHPSVQILADDVAIGEGSVICANTILTTNVKIGKHCHLNLSTTIGHDTIIGDYFTTAPGAKISGNCNIGDCVYVGTNTSIKEKINICDNVIIGLNSGVVKNITEEGTFIGTPTIKIK